MTRNIVYSVLILFLLVLYTTTTVEAAAAQLDRNTLKVSLTISAEKRRLEVSWINAQVESGDVILVTNQEPITFKKLSRDDLNNRNAAFEASGDEGSGLSVIPLFSSISDSLDSSSASSDNTGSWMYTNSNARSKPVLTIKPEKESDWITTDVNFDFSIVNSLNISTRCYGFWASYVDVNGTILDKTCIRAYPNWMTEMQSKIENFRVRDLIIPGSHDSGSYRPGFDPASQETVVTKYSLTQDHDIRAQLLHGMRYLDIRVGYYRATKELFWVNHGITRQRPLSEVLEQVREFVLATNEIVVFDVQEFPVGFGKNLDIHRLLVKYLVDKIGDLIVDPSLTWQAKLKEIWYRKKNIILCYDQGSVVDEFPNFLFRAVEQRWGNVQTWEDLEKYLIRINQQALLRFASRPVADMAELTPDAWGVVTDKFGGLRRMADDVNRHVSKLYHDDLGHSANIVSLDFYMGTTIVETALEYNLKRASGR